MSLLGTIAGIVIFWGGLIGAIHSIAGVRKWFVSRSTCEFFFPETGVQCSSFALKGSVYCEVHETKIREKEFNSNGSTNEV